MCQLRFCGNTIRSASSQVLAGMSSNLLLLDLGLAVSFATIAIPDLLNNPTGLSIDDSQASWFGSIPFLTQPIGALLSGPLMDHFGRKKANILANIPHLVAWILMYFAWNVPSLFLATSLLGLGTGFMEAPITAYLGEICHPSLRGTLTTFNQCFAHVGTLTMYGMGSLLHWRQAALICLVFPIVSIILSILAPDSPVWLISRGKENDALKALCYLRGWSSKEDVKEEFDQLQRYAKTLHHCVLCPTNENHSLIQECEHSRLNALIRLFFKFKHMIFCKETLRPMSLIMLYFIFFVMSGLVPIRPNMVNVCRAFGMPGDGNDIVFMTGIISFIMSIVQTLIIKFLGKRKMALSGMFGLALCATGLSIYAKTSLRANVSSYQPRTFPTETSYTPLAIFYLMPIFLGLGVPWIVIGEIFPFKSRASAQGLAAAGDYIIKFIASKTYINLEQNVHLDGTFAVYATFGFIGTIYLYFFLPETEGRSLEEIEKFYKGKRFKTFADDPFINYIRKVFF